MEQYPTVVRIVSSLDWNELNQHHLNSHIMPYTHDHLSDYPSLGKHKLLTKFNKIHDDTDNNNLN